MAKASDETESTADGDIEELRAEVERLSKALEDAKTMLKEEGEEVAATLADAAEDLGERIEEGFSDLKKQISEHPVSAALAAFVIGLVLGRIIAS